MDSDKEKGYEKYSGPPKRLEIVAKVKKFHNQTKRYYIKNFASNSRLLVDVGSGRGTDIRFWADYKVEWAIGIEPSQDSIKRAIRYLIHLKKERTNLPKVQYLNGVGNLRWANGTAAIRPEDRDRFIQLFGKRKLKAENINMHWTIHYMMDTEGDFQTLMTNITNHTKENSLVTILCMNGEKIHRYLQKHDGVYDVTTPEEETAFRLDARYDYKQEEFPPYGSQISVQFAGVYGLGKGIEENLVSIEHLTREFKKVGFQLEHQEDYLNLPIDEKDELRDYERKISDLYMGLVFRRV